MNPLVSFCYTSLCLMLLAVPGYARTLYVNAQTGSDANDGSLEAPFLTLQAAVDAAEAEDTVLVAPGVYDQGGRSSDDPGDPLMNRVFIDKPLTLMSTDGPGVTTIAGQPGSGPDGLGEDAVRGILAEESGTLIAGFTITNGFTAANGWGDDSCGGGARLGWDHVVLSNCVIVGNAADNGGGVYQGTLQACRIVGNTAREIGGGLLYGKAENSLFIGNHARQGGGAYNANIIHCTVVGNSASDLGGGLAWCDTYNSIVY